MKAKPRPIIGDDGLWIGVTGGLTRYVGAYALGDRDLIMVWFQKRPPWYQRLLMRWLLGWRWLDAAGASTSSAVD